MGDTIQVKEEIKPLSDCISNGDVSSEYNFPLGNNIKTEVETKFEPKLMNEDEIKIEIEEVDIKKECFGDMYEDITDDSNPSLHVTADEEHPLDFDVDINNIKELEAVSEDNRSIVLEENSSGSSTNHVPDSKPCFCDVCEKTFENKSQLVYHKRIHGSKKKFSCDVCKKELCNKTTLIKHRRIHTGEKPFLCSVCKKSFTEYKQLNIHERIHTGEKPYQCEICKKWFRSFANRYRHERTHYEERLYQCDMCEKSFKYSSVLKDHKLIHTGEKHFSCDVCQKEFRKKYTLTTHKLIHTRGKSYSCSICNELFENKETLANHKRAQHKLLC